MSRTSIPDDAMMRSQQAVDLGRGKEDELEPGSDGALTEDVERMEGRPGARRKGFRATAVASRAARPSRP